MHALAPPSATSGRDVQRFVQTLDRRLERLDQGILIADWDLYTGSSTRGAGDLQIERSSLLSHPDLVEWIRTSRTHPQPRDVARRLELLERLALDAQVEQHPEVVRRRERLTRRIVAFRPRWEGRRVNRAVVRRLVRTSRDRRVRERAFRALEPLYRPLEAGLRELVEIRNARARDMGYPNFAEMRLRMEGVSLGRLDSLVEDGVREIPSLTRRLRDSYLARHRDSGWAVWDLAHAQHEVAHLPEAAFPAGSMLPRILAEIGRWGFPRHRLRFRVVFHDLPAGGLTLAPDPPRDVRILVHPRGGWQSYLVMFHEVGHAVHSASIRAPRHLLRWHEYVPGFGGYHEGIGALFERIARDPNWLARQSGLPRARVAAFASTSHQSELLGPAGVCSWMRTELNLYRHPHRDPRVDQQRFERKMYGFDSYAPLSFVDSFFVDSPIYAPNYFLAALFQHQLAATIVDRLGAPLWPNRRVGPWLSKNWFGPGSYIDGFAHLAKLSGRPFGPDDYRSAVTAAVRAPESGLAPRS